MKHDITSLDLTTISEKYGTEESARALFEKLRWPNETVCPKCACFNCYRMTPLAIKERKNGAKLKGKPGRKGLWRCRDCGSQFTVTVGTIMEDSHIPLHTWLKAIYLLTVSKKGMSALQLQRMMNLNYKSAWFMAHRIRHAMLQPPLKDKIERKLTGIVEVDETYVGGKSGGRGRRRDVKIPVFTLVQRGGAARSQAMRRVDGASLRQAIRENVAPDAQVFSDSYPGYNKVYQDFSKHEMVNHYQREYARGIVHTNTVEGFFSLLKRGIIGTYHRVSAEHLPRYLAEFDFRYSRRAEKDQPRTLAAIAGCEGKRLTYKQVIPKDRINPRRGKKQVSKEVQPNEVDLTE
jgi:transposase-like protein